MNHLHTLEGVQIVPLCLVTQEQGSGVSLACVTVSWPPRSFTMGLVHMLFLFTFLPSF